MSAAIVKSDPASVVVSMDTVQGFEALQRIAKLFSNSDLVPKQFQNIQNATIAIDMAMRMGANPLMVMQNLYIVHNQPSWSAKFLIATFNKCGRFSSIKYETHGVQDSDDFGCRAFSTEISTGEKVIGPFVTIKIAKDEGWTKNSTKWKNLPELMLRYRAATFLIRTVAPEIAMGLQTKEEVEDTLEMDRMDDGTYSAARSSARERATVNLDDIKPGNAESHTPVDAPFYGKKKDEDTVYKQEGDSGMVMRFKSAYAKLNILYDERGTEIDNLLFKHHAKSESLINIDKDNPDPADSEAVFKAAEEMK